MKKLLLKLSIIIIIFCFLIPAAYCLINDKEKRMSENISLIPKPEKLEMKSGSFVFSNNTPVIYNEFSKTLAGYLSEQFKNLYGIEIKTGINEGKNNTSCINLEINKSFKDANPESYSISIKPDGISILSGNEKGLFMGIQTLLQIFPDSIKKNENISIQIPCLEIFDKPRFEWRGLNLDCGRHFMTKDFIKRYIDILASYKFNKFHWHLTEDQGWRIEIKKYPKLTEIGAWRKEADGTIYGGFYTQNEIKEIVEYAKSRYITIIPEIEMPGHCLASLASYPENSCTGGPFEVGTQWGVMKDVYCAGNEKTYEFLENILTEVIALFPSEYIHIGGDEAPKDRWKECPKCQAKIKSEKLKDEHELQSYFIKRISDFLASKGKKIIGWGEILQGGLSSGATVQSWEDFKAAIEAVKQKHYSVCSPASHTYLNGDADNLNLQTCYSFNPIPEELKEEEWKYILGSEANLWTEQAPQETVDGKLFPRILALAEVFWTNNPKNYDEFYARVQKHYSRLTARNIKYGPETKAIIYSTSYNEQEKEFTISLKSSQNNIVLHYTLDGSEPSETSPIYNGPIKLKGTATFRVAAYKDGQSINKSLRLSFVKNLALGAKITLNNSFNPRYIGGGNNGVIDGARGTNRFNDSQWQGYEGTDFEGIIDLGKKTDINKVTVGCLQESSSWIFLPEYIEVQVSDDNVNFKPAGMIKNDISPKATETILKDFPIKMDGTSTRYIKVKAKNMGACPPWHPGNGSKAWIFLDEIIVE
jgi:hexosaminidase